VKTTNPLKWAYTSTPQDIRESLVSILDREKAAIKYSILKVLCDRANLQPDGEISQALEWSAERMGGENKWT